MKTSWVTAAQESCPIMKAPFIPLFLIGELNKGGTSFGRQSQKSFVDKSAPYFGLRGLLHPPREATPELGHHCLDTTEANNLGS